MKKTAYAVMGLLLAAGSAMAQQKAAGSGDEAALKAIEERWVAAGVKADSAALGAILADTVVLTDSDGKTRTKAEEMARWKSGEIKYQTSKVDDIQVVQYGDTAVVTVRWTGKGTDKGKAFDAIECWTDTFVKQNGQWRCIASHSSTPK